MDPRHPKKHHILQTLLFVCLLVSGCNSIAQRAGADFVTFEKEILDEQFAGGYGITVADINGDGRLDIVALATSPAQLAWYRNPDWQKFIIQTGTSGNIDVAPHDINGNGRVDLVLASEFNLRDSESGGRVHWLENPGNPEEKTDWAMHLIDQVPTSHRVRWGDLNGDGRKQLINLPIIGVGARAPDYTGGAHLKAYNIPRDPRSSPWGAVVLDRDQEMAHAMMLYDWDGDGREDVLTGSFSGVELIQVAVRGQLIDRQLLIAAQQAPRPNRGVSEVAIGISGRPERRFIATIEPWHGNEVVVYRPEAETSSFRRAVLYDELASGHALAVADLNNDGFDEIIAGARGNPNLLLVFRYNPETRTWRNFPLDSGIAVSGIVVADVTGNGFRDIMAVGSSTANVVLFQNSGR